MMTKTHDERIREAGDKYVELMDLTFRMHMTEEIDFNRVMELLRSVYSDQLELINLVNKYEKENSSNNKTNEIQIPEFVKTGVQ